MNSLSKNNLLNLRAIQKYGMLIILILIIFIFSLLSSNFLTYSNIMSMLRQISIIGVVAAGQTLVILTGGIDLSVGSVIAFSGVISALVASSTGNIVLGIVAGLLAGLLVGAFNGVLIAKLNLSPLIVTLAGLSLFAGLALVISDGNPIIVSDSSYTYLGQGYIGSVPFPIILMLLVYIVLTFILKKTIHGQYIYSIGGNEQATVLAGVKVDIHKILVYMTSGLLAGLAGVILTARLSSASPVAGSGYELDAIAAVILGGTSLFGGRGNVFGTIIGVMILGILTSGMNLVNVSPFYQDVAKGLIILFAIIIDRFINKNE